LNQCCRQRHHYVGLNQTSFILSRYVAIKISLSLFKISKIRFKMNGRVAKDVSISHLPSILKKTPNFHGKARSLYVSICDAITTRNDSSRYNSYPPYVVQHANKPICLENGLLMTCEGQAVRAHAQLIGRRWTERYHPYHAVPHSCLYTIILSS
jgi:hypothetical protein